MRKTPQEKATWFESHKYATFHELRDEWIEESREKPDTIVNILTTAFKHNESSYECCLSARAEIPRQCGYPIHYAKLGEIDVPCFQFQLYLKFIKNAEYFISIDKWPDYLEMEFESVAKLFPYPLDKQRIIEKVFLMLKELKRKGIICACYTMLSLDSYNGLVRLRSIDTNDEERSKIQSAIEESKGKGKPVLKKEYVPDICSYDEDDVLPSCIDHCTEDYVQPTFLDLLAKEKEQRLHDHELFIHGSKENPYYKIKLNFLVDILDKAKEVYSIEYPALFKSNFTEQYQVAANRELLPLIDVCQKVYEHLWVDKDVDDYTRLKKSKKERLDQIKEWTDANKIELEWRDGKTYFLSHEKLDSVVRAIEAITTPARLKKPTK